MEWGEAEAGAGRQTNKHMDRQAGKEVEGVTEAGEEG